MPKRASVVNFFRVRRGNLKTMGADVRRHVEPASGHVGPREMNFFLAPSEICGKLQEK